MNSMQTLLHELNDLGIKLGVDGSKLRINAPKGSLTAELRDSLSTHKAELLNWLSDRQTTRPATPIRPARRTEVLPLSFGQERLWFLDQLEDQGGTYNLIGAFRLEGPCQPAALETALEAVIARHEILRTTFPEVEGRPVQRILALADTPSPLRFHDFTQIDDAEATALGMLRESAMASFELTCGPLLRVELIAIAPENFLLLIVMHHIISDGWSMGCFIDEMVACYRQATAAEPARLPPLAIQYADFAVWQRASLDNAALDRQAGFWREHLAGAPALLELPTDRPRPASQSFRGQTCHFSLDKALSERLKQVGQRQGCTTYMTLLAAFASLLERYSGQTDILVGSPVATRSRAETEALIGFFLNTLVMRVRPQPHQSFRDLLDQVQRTTLAAFAHQDLPFSAVVDAINPERVLGYNPIFQVMFDLQNAPAGVLEIPGLRLTPLLLDELGPGTAMFDLSWTMQEHPDGFTGQVEFASDLFDPGTIERWIAGFATLLAAIVESPDAPLGQLNLVPAAERRLMLEIWNPAVEPVPAPPFHTLVAVQAARNPAAPAVVWNGRRLSYGDLERQSNQLAHYLVQCGLRSGERVGVCLDRSSEMVVAVLAVLKAGGAYVPLDPAYPRERLAFMQRDADLTLVISQSQLTAAIAVDDIPVFEWDVIGEYLSGLPATAPAIDLGPDDPAYIIYTSGSTGTPKGVVVPHGAVTRTYRAWEQAYGLGQAVRSHLQMAAFSFDVCTGDMVRALGSGGKLVLCPRDYLLSPADLYDLMVSEAVDCAEFVPAVLRELVAYLDATGGDLAFMQVLIAGSDSWYGEEYARFKQLCGPRTRLINSYGVTEAVIDSTYFELGDQPLVPERHVPIGRPFADTRVYVLDSRGQPVPVGIPGELYLAGPRLALGYWRQPELTAARFVPDPFSPSPTARMYRTGDAARYLADGNIEFLGRIDQQVKLRGFRIELGEVESVIGQHPAVQAAVAQVCTDARGRASLVAYAVASGVEAGALQAFARERLPDYMIPGAIVFVEQFPLTPNGKIDRKALPAPAVAAAEPSMALATPIGPTETALAAIWEQVLGTPVGRSSNFFALGGDSILAMQVVSRARAAGLPLTPRLLFQHQQIADLAAAVGAAPQIAPSRGIDPATVGGPAPLTPVQRWFADIDPPNPHHYNQSLVLQVAPDLEPAALEAALQRLVSQHPALRLRWQRTAAGWEQGHAGSAAAPCEIASVAAADPAAWHACVEEIGVRLQTNLHLTDGPLFRAALVRGPAESRLILVAHHVVIDGVSWRVLVEDLALLLAGEAMLPGSAPFAAWAEYLVGRAASPETLADRALWQEIVRSVPQLPCDYPPTSSANTVASAETWQTRLDSRLTRALLQNVNQAYATQITEVLLAALALACHSWAGGDLVLDLESHGRIAGKSGLDLSRSVGWFTSVYPARLTLPADAGAETALKAVKEQLRRLPEGGLSYGLLRYLHPDADIRRSVTPDLPVALAFNYLGQTDQAASLGPFRGLAAESAGPEQALDIARCYLIEINAYVSEDSLVVNWEYSRTIHRAGTIHALAAAFQTALETLIDHCRDTRNGGLTPSDVPLSGLDQSQIDMLWRRVGGRVGGSQRRAIADIYPLAPLQAGMLYHSLLAPEQGLYIEQLRCTLEGSIDVMAFRRAWAMLAERHHVFRTEFHTAGLSQPLQVVLSQVEIPGSCEDWRTAPAETLADALHDYALAERERGFDLAQAPLMRWALIQLGPATWHFIWTHHHLLVDGWSVPIVFGEVFALYAALSTNSEPTLAPATPYRDYIAWLQEQDRSAAATFWRHQLADFNEPTPLPGDRSGRPQAPRREVERHRLDVGLSRDLGLVARQHGLTLNTLVQAAWSLVLSRYSGRSDVLFGATAAGRPPSLEGAEGMVGLFINTLPVRIDTSPDHEILIWLHRIQSNQLELSHYTSTPLVDIQGWSGVPRGTPLFESILVFENYPLGEGDPGPAQVRVSDVQATEQTNYPLTVIAAPGEQLDLGISYDCSRFARPLVRQLLEDMDRVLLQLSAIPASLRAIDLRPSGRHAWIDDLNTTAAAYPDCCLHDLLTRQACKSPDQVAVVSEGQTLTYAELNGRANQLAHYLRAHGIGPDVFVGLYLDRSPEMVVALLAVLKSGGAYVPLDPAFPAERLAYMAEDSKISVLLTNLGGRELPESLLDGPWIGIDVQAHAPSIRALPVSELSPSASPHHLAYAIYTSGSTGRPKGVLIEHRAVVNFLWSMRHRPGIDASDVLLAVTTLSFDIAVLELYLPLMVGARLVIASRDEGADARRLADLLAAHQVTLMQATPATWRMLLAAGWPGEQRLRILCGGEALPRDLAAELLSRVGELWNMYGPTETTVWSSVAPIGAATLAESWNLPIGRPIANTQMYVLDADLQPMPAGAIGELYIGGTGLARGYHDQPELSSERFIRDPFSTIGDARLYRTGDLARYRPDGSLECLGRMDHQVKIRGYRIELSEIEYHLLNHPAVGQAVAVVREDQPGDQRLVAYVVAPGATADLSTELAGLLSASLPAYMLPNPIVVLEQFPLTPNGKIDRRSLPAPAIGSVAFTAPRDTLELELVQIWEQVLQARPIGIHDNFFALGGHSMLAVSLVARMQPLSAQPLTLTLLHQAPTIAELVQVLQRSPDQGSATLVPIQPKGARRPIFCLPGAGGNVMYLYPLAQELGIDQPFYALQSIGLDGTQPPLTSVEAMAEVYLDAVRGVQPSGPYVLVGHSFGADIAWAMADRLRSSGDEVAILISLDSPAPRRRGGASQSSRTPDQWLAAVVEVLEHAYGIRLDLSIEQLVALEPRRQLEALADQLKAAGVLSPNTPVEYVANFIDVFRANHEATFAPRAVPDIPVVLFQAEDEPVAETEQWSSSPSWLWEELTDLPVERRRLPGDHFTLLNQPHVAALARAIETLLVEHQ